MPRMVEGQLELTESDMFELEQELNRLKQIEGFDRANYTTIDKCLLLLQMYSVLDKKHAGCGFAANGDVLLISSDIQQIHDIAVQVRDNEYYRDDLVRRIVDITLKHKV